MAVAFLEIDIFKLFKTSLKTSGRLNSKFVLRILAFVHMGELIVLSLLSWQ